MARRVGIRVAGIERTIKRLEEFTNPARIERALDEAAVLVERDATLNVPVDSGETQTKITVEATAPLRRRVGSDSPQAVWTEYSIAHRRDPISGMVHDETFPRQGPWPYEKGGKLKGTKATATMPWLRPALLKNWAAIVLRIRNAVLDR